MQFEPQHAHPPAGGFSLIELMIVVAGRDDPVRLAVPSYISYIRQSRRTGPDRPCWTRPHGKSDFSSTNPAAIRPCPGTSGTPHSAFGRATLLLSDRLPPAAVACAPNPPAAPSFSVLATPVAGQKPGQRRAMHVLRS